MGCDIITIGASMGGVPVLQRIVSDLPSELGAAVFVVLHVGAFQSQLAEILDKEGPLPAARAIDGEPIVPGRIYVAPPDHHLMIEPGRVRLGRGPKENRTRPAIDPLFRSAAAAYGPAVAGVILTGLLDDGTAGLLAIKDRGGVAVVQEPAEAEAPSMPTSALRHVTVDHVRPASEIGALLGEVARDPPLLAPTVAAVSPLMELENHLARGGLAMRDLPIPQQLGAPLDLTCPDCGAVLFEVRDHRVLRFRCRMGHAFGVRSLLAAWSERREDVLWSALGALEAEIALARRLAGREADAATVTHLLGRAARLDGQASNLRAWLESKPDLIEPDHPAGAPRSA